MFIVPLATSWAEFKDIVLMQGFAGLNLFAVFLLMALGLAIIFGQMGVINMAHGDFMTLGAYVTVYVSQFVQAEVPGFLRYYFPLAMLASFVATFILGWLVEVCLIRYLYKRPLDTLLATWGLSMIMQQAFRSGFGRRATSATLPNWLMSSWQLNDVVSIPVSGVMLLIVAAVTTGMVVLFFHRTSWGLRQRATTENRKMAGAIGINTKRTDRMTFALGCGIAGIAGAAFTTYGSVAPTAGNDYIVKTFIVVVFGGAGSLLGTILSAFSIAQAESISSFYLNGVLASVLTLLAVVVILMIRPRGLLGAKIRS